MKTKSPYVYLQCHKPAARRGDLPHHAKATAEGDDDGGNNSAQEVDGILAKV